MGHTVGYKPRHAKIYRNFAAEFERLQKEQTAAFKELIADVKSGAYPRPEHEEFEKVRAASQWYTKSIEKVHREAEFRK